MRPSSLTNLSGLLRDAHVEQRALGLGDGLVDLLVGEAAEVRGLGGLGGERGDGRGAAGSRGEGCCAPAGGREGGGAHGVEEEGGREGGMREREKEEKKVWCRLRLERWEEKKNSGLLSRPLPSHLPTSSLLEKNQQNMASRAEPCSHAEAWAAARGGPAQAYLPIQRCLVEEWREARARAAANASSSSSNILADEVREKK